MTRTRVTPHRKMKGAPSENDRDVPSSQTISIDADLTQEIPMLRLSQNDRPSGKGTFALRRGHTFPWMIGWLAISLLCTAIIVGYLVGDSPSESLSDTVDIKSGNRLAAESSVTESDASMNETDRESTPTIFATHIRRPSGPPQIELDQADPQGRVGKIACSTCHSVREPNFNNRKPSDLKTFHQDMPMAHGELACYSCHNPTNADALHLADGTSVSYPDVMTLCSQCHGPQARDYAHGAHGGMNGYWDLTRGPRQRNNCIDCHDPHVPKFPSMQPTFKPRDRFLDPTHHASGPVHEQFSSEAQAHE